MNTTTLKRWIKNKIKELEKERNEIDTLLVIYESILDKIK